jgi:lysophospholipase L1-like esterase
MLMEVLRAKNATGLVFDNSTIRQTIMVTLSAPKIRLQISNTFGGSDLPITAVTLAVPKEDKAGTSSIKAGTLQTLTFSGSRSFIVPNGASILSDPVDFPVAAQTIVTISMYLKSGQTTNNITSHPGSRTTSYFVHGNHVEDEDLKDTASAAHWYFIQSIEGLVPAGSAAVACVGDSITDGRGSTTDANNRWPNQLAARLQAEPRFSHIAVVNEAAGGNRILADGLGPNALGRIDRDVISMPGVKYAIIFEGVNDLGSAGNDTETQKVIGDRVIQAYDQIITRLHRFGIAVFGATITPITGPQSIYSDPEREKTRQRLNEWIRSSGKFDAVIDFDKATRDPENPVQLLEAYNSGDFLHLSPGGYKAMAEAVDLTLFDKFGHGV